MIKRASFLAPLIFLGCHQQALIRGTAGQTVNPTIEMVGTTVFVIAGQSNAVGAGFEPGLPPDARVTMYGLDGQFHTAYDPLHDQTRSIEPDLSQPISVNVGFGRYFANRILQKAPHAKILLVPCAKGATSIDEWEPGQPLFETMVRRTKEALAKSGGHMGGLLFWQGETLKRYPATQELADNWPIQFSNMVRAFGQRIGGNIPVIYVQVHSKGNEDFREETRAAQATVNLPYTYMVPCEDIHQINGVGEHYNTAGYAAMGARIADKFVQEFVDNSMVIF